MNEPSTYLLRRLDDPWMLAFVELDVGLIGGMVGRPKITESAMNIARALCKVQDIERTQRKAYDDWVMNDFRCPISKIGSAVSAAERPPN